MKKYRSMHEIWGIILAAGESKRMKTQKLILPFQDKTMIEKVVEHISLSEIDNTIIVVGSNRDEIIDAIGRLNLVICYNENYKDGMLSSVKCGMRSLPESCEAVMIFLGDQPLIPAKVIDAVIVAYENTDKGIIIPTYNNKRGHPLLLDRRYFEEIQGLKNSLKELSLMHAEDIKEVETGFAGILKDIDTPEEYNKIVNDLKVRSRNNISGIKERSRN